MTRTPTLSDVRGWNTGELTNAALAWTSTAQLWETTFAALRDQVVAPWNGVAADRALERADTDHRDILVAADRLHAAATAARDGAARIAAARDAVLQDAGETAALSVRLDRLLVLDRQVAAEINAAAMGFGRELPTTGALPLSPPAPAAPTPGRLPEDPQQFAQWWNTLTDQEKDRLFDADGSIGNHGGMPFTERDVYNRRHLDRLRTQTAAEVGALQTRFDDLAAQLYMGDHSESTTGEMHDLTARLSEARQRLDGYDAVREALDHHDGVPRLLGLIDEQGHAAISLGDPDNARRTAVFVPGTGQDTTTLDGNGRRAMDMFNAALAADPNLTTHDVAVTTWVGYDRPMTLTEAAWPDRARHGGAALDRYLDGMHASHSGPAAIDTVIGHSYGSTVIGAAATGGNHLGADNVIAVGSPGMLSRHAGDLDLDPGGRVFSMTAGNDPISLVTSLTLGTDPNDADYGATRLPADRGPGLPYSAGLLPAVPAHSSYWDEGNPGLAAMGAIIAGLAPTVALR